MLYYYLTFSLITIWLTVLGWYDSYYRRLPNYLTLGGAVVFLIMRFALGGTQGIVNGLIGGLIGGAFLLLPFLLRGAGAGDVKMFFAVGCLVGYKPVFPMIATIFPIMIIATVFGLILGVIMIIKGRLDSSRLKHFFKCCCCIHYDRVEGRKNLPPKNKEAVRIPFGVAIAAGTWCGLLINAIVLR